MTTAASEAIAKVRRSRAATTLAIRMFLRTYQPHPIGRRTHWPYAHRRYENFYASGLPPDLTFLFALSASPLEIMLRGTVVFWLLFIIFRFILRRDIGSVGVSDFLFVVIVADASQNAMSGDAKTIADGVLLVATLVFWNFLLDWVSYKSKFVRRITEAPPILLVKSGKLQLKNMRREFITREEIFAKLRQQGLERLEQVKEMRLEGDGEISVIKNNG